MIRPQVALAPLLLALAGCTGADDRGANPLDTGTIAPGAEKTLTFREARDYGLHCDPHPFMRHNVTAQAGGALKTHVHILDGATTDEYRFDPQNITVSTGAVVAYHNHGTLEHTASEMTAGMDHGGH